MIVQVLPGPRPHSAIHLDRIRRSVAARTIALLRQRAGRLRMGLFVLVLLSPLLTTSMCART